VLTVGLTGGIGSGKSAVSALLATQGAAVVDADLIARDVVAPGTPGMAAVIAAFGPQLLLSDGSLDRSALGGLVFADDGARKRLNGIVHPLIAERTRLLFAAAERDRADVVVHDVPLLVEAGLAPGYHLVVVVHAPVDVRLARLAARGLPEPQARARMAAQADDTSRRAVADVWLDNAGSQVALAAQVTSLWDDRLAPFARNLAASRPALRGRVELVAPRQQWAVEAARLSARLRWLCPDADVRHIGSTAVPGLIAKDVLDLQVEVATWSEVEALDGSMTRGGFVRRPDVSTDPVRPDLDPDPDQWRKRVNLSADPGRAANVHVRVAGTTAARAAVAFRDLLRTDGQARQAYAALKHRLAERHPDDVDAYAEGKTDLIMRLLGHNGIKIPET